MRAFGLAAVLFTAALLHAQPTTGDERKGDTLKGDKSFDDVTLKQIKEAVDAAKKEKREKIDGSDTKDNEMPKGTILCFVTDQKRYGKLKVLEYGYDLTIKWVTYDEKGNVFSKGDKLVVRGTWGCDLDYGVEGDEGKSPTDFWWEQRDKKRRYITSQRGAVLTVYQAKKEPSPEPRP